MDIGQEELFEIIGVYFANCYWNTLYTQAVEAWREERFRTVREAYENNIKVFTNAFCQQKSKHYLSILKDLYQYYRTQASQETLSGFINLLAKFLIPRDSYEHMSHDRKTDAVVKTILCQTLTKFTMHIINNSIDTVINENTRSDQKLVIQLKDYFIKCIKAERDAFSSLLLAKSNGINIKNQDEIPTISKEVSDKMQNKIRELIEEREVIKKERNQLVQAYRQLMEVVSKQRQTIAELEKNQYRPGFRRGYYNNYPPYGGAAAYPNVGNGNVIVSKHDPADPSTWNSGEGVQPIPAPQPVQTTPVTQISIPEPASSPMEELRQLQETDELTADD